MTTARPAKVRTRGQWAMGNRRPLKPNEEMTQAEAPLDMRERIENTYAKNDFDSIDNLGAGHPTLRVPNGGALSTAGLRASGQMLEDGAAGSVECFQTHPGGSLGPDSASDRRLRQHKTTSAKATSAQLGGQIERVRRNSVEYRTAGGCFAQWVISQAIGLAIRGDKDKLR